MVILFNTLIDFKLTVQARDKNTTMVRVSLVQYAEAQVQAHKASHAEQYSRKRRLCARSCA